MASTVLIQTSTPETGVASEKWQRSFYPASSVNTSKRRVTSPKHRCLGERGEGDRSQNPRSKTRLAGERDGTRSIGDRFGT